MRLLSLRVRQVRNLTALDLQPASHLNILTGPNAAGKTSVLEAVHILGRARSFRARRLEDVVQWGAEQASIAGEVARPEGGSLWLGVGYERGRPALRIGGEDVKGASELAEWLPLQVINPDSHRLLEAGPERRRQYLDWGVFHVEQAFHAIWRRYRRALRQRNQALRTGSEILAPWERELGETGAAIDRFRQAYLAELGGFLPEVVTRTLGSLRVSLTYDRGWPAGRPLAEVLEDARGRDSELGFTRSGPHRADLGIRINGVPAQHTVSRGQQKALAASLLLAQAALYTSRSGRPCLFLVDDLPAELDVRHREALLAMLRDLDTQVFVTALEPGTLAPEGWGEVKRFHVEQGTVIEMV
ncbi:MAG: DNA replication/repair protein RecF [Gammaproteobacteria bacterium]|nr:DNA replication/repair protein RecF [Gammaproteobacteria bacterium]